MALDPLEMAAHREQADDDDRRAAEYRKRAKVATSARDRLRLEKLAEAIQGKADRLREWIRGKYRREQMKAEFAAEAAGNRGCDMPRELTQREVDLLSDDEFLHYHTSGRAKPVTRSIGDQFGGLVAELRAALAAADEDERLARQFAEIQRSQYRPAITISKRRGF